LKDYGCTLKAYRREVIEDVKLYGEMHRFIPALVSWSGAKVTEVPVRHERRRFGKSKYGISRTLRVLLDLITVKFLGSYSTKPLYVFGMAVRSGPAPDLQLLTRMCDTLVHRGPDDQGILLRDGVGLGVRRLAIIDPVGGHQPIHNEGKTTWIVFNGEIYNFPELRARL